MALRNIVEKGDSVLAKHCRPVTDFNEKLHILLDDMAETLMQANGVGLAEPQVGLLRRAVLVLETNHAEDEDDYIIELINPEIVAKSGAQEGPEGCLSIPGRRCTVERPTKVVVHALNRRGREIEVTGTSLLARCLCHEIDHLDGILYVDKMIEDVTDKEGN